MRWTMKDKDIKKIFTDYANILIDSREKDLSIKEVFDSLGTHYRVTGLPYGDYGIEIVANEEFGIKEDILLKVRVERKNSLDEISQNLTKHKDRFHREMQKCIDDGGTMVIMIEGATYEDIINHNYRSELQPKPFLALLHSITSKYGVQFVFISKRASSLFVYNYLKYYAREYLKNL